MEAAIAFLVERRQLQAAVIEVPAGLGFTLRKVSGYRAIADAGEAASE
ncbi:MAG TPA: hypothetical protein VKD90_21605 [Gemmataceae bacterium]|nr:hypothetical protein [Gemmataceae bacterium]